MADSENERARPKSIRERRLGEALRANLKRRKDQQRSANVASKGPEAQNGRDR